MSIKIISRCSFFYGICNYCKAGEMVCFIGNNRIMLSKEYRIHYLINWRLAYPLVLGQAGHMITNIADTIMVGRLGSTELAAASIAYTVFIIMFVFGIGVLTATTTIAGKAFGEKDTEKLRVIFYNGLITTIAFGLVLTALLYVSKYVFPHLGQMPEVIELALPFYEILIFSMFPFLIFLHYKHFVDALTRTKPGMVIIISCNIINVILNYGLIFGKLGMPEIGLNGAAIATVIARTLMAISFIIIFKYSKALSIYVKGISHRLFSMVRIREIFKLGIPIGVQHILEVGLFVIGAIMTGWLGAQELAAYQIVMSLATLTFIMSGGVATAATVRISNLLGERKYKRLRTAGFSAFNMVGFFMFFAGIIFYFGRTALPGLYIAEPEVIEIASTLMIIAAMFQLMDGAQVTALGALRGMQDVNFPTYIALLSYWLIALPISYILGIYMQWGVSGIWIGFIFGLIFAAIILTSRFVLLSRRLINSKE